LRIIAATELPPRTFHFAQQHGLSVKRVTVRNQITLGFMLSTWNDYSELRLIQTPTDVSDYIVLHELMHLRQMNHSPTFWREIENVCPGFRKAEKWLKKHSSLLLSGCT
jgi:predicted metal-dependent hydrolase